MEGSELVSCLIGIAFVGGFIALVMILSSGAKQAEHTIGQVMQRLPQDKQMLFTMHYVPAKKNPTTAVMLALFLGNIGIHKFYLGQTFLGIVYLLFCWTFIPGIIAIIEALFITGAVAEYNRRKAMEIYHMIGGHYA